MCKGKWKPGSFSKRRKVKKKSLGALRAPKRICSCRHQMITKTVFFGDKVVRRENICNNPDCEKSVHGVQFEIKCRQDAIARVLNGQTRKG